MCHVHDQQGSLCLSPSQRQHQAPCHGFHGRRTIACNDPAPHVCSRANAVAEVVRTVECDVADARALDTGSTANQDGSAAKGSLPLFHHRDSNMMYLLQKHALV